MWPMMICARLAGFAQRHELGNKDVEAIHCFDFCGLITLVKNKVRRDVEFALLRTMLNSWITSSRIKNQATIGVITHECAFGCQSLTCSSQPKCDAQTRVPEHASGPAWLIQNPSDTLAHCIMCPNLWGFLIAAFKSKQDSLLLITTRLGLTLVPACLFVCLFVCRCCNSSSFQFHKTQDDQQ